VLARRRYSLGGCMSQSGLNMTYCRRCRVCLGCAEVVPGALIGCISCRLFTRATLTHQQPPLTRIMIRSSTVGAQVYFYPGVEFEAILDEFKAAIPRKCRTYVDGHWFIQRRSESRLEKFLDSLGDRVVLDREKSKQAGASFVA
jgi:hypothetical protein